MKGIISIDFSKSREVSAIKQDKLDLNDLRKHFAILLFLLLGFLAFLVLKPFLVSIVMGAILAFIFFPAFTWMNKKIRNRKLCSAILTVLILLLLAFPFTLILNVIAQESLSLYSSTRQFLRDDDFLLDQLNCTQQNTESSMFCQALDTVQDTIGTRASRQIADSVNTLIQNLVRITANFITSIPNKIIQLLMMFITLYVVFLDGPVLVRKITGIIPLTKDHKTKLYKEFSNIVDGVIYGQVLTALIQGIVASIGFYIFGVSSPLIWGLLFTSFFAMIPFLGAASIWGAISVVKFIQGMALNEPVVIGKAIGLALYGFFIISMIDNILRPKFMGDKAKMNYAISFASILGGLAFFGIAGLILGPVIISLFIAVINIYINEVDNTQDN